MYKDYFDNKLCWLASQTEYKKENLKEFILSLIRNPNDYFEKKNNMIKFSYQNTWNDINQKLLAVDWSSKSLELIKKNSKNNKISIDTYKFNFKKPFLPKLNCSVDIVLTVHALEQVFTNYKKFLKI